MSKFTTEEKTQAVNRYLTGKESSHNIRKYLKIRHVMILEWVKRYEPNRISTFIKNI